MTDKTDDFDLEITQETCPEQNYEAVIRVKKTNSKETVPEQTEIDEIQAMQGEEMKDAMEGEADLPRANENNELINELDGEKYLTIGTLSKLETIDAGDEKIRKIIIENNIQGLKGKSKNNGIYDFYPVEEVKKHTNANKDLPRANENNELINELDGEKYLTIGTLSKLETIDAGDERKIKKIIKENNIQSIKGKDKIGRIRNFYPIEEVKKHTNTNKDLPRANKNNELIIDGKIYLTIRALGKLETIDAGEKKIKKIIIENNIQSVKGKDKTNRICYFYPFEEVKKHTNANKDLPRANDNNELIIDGKKYLTIWTLRDLETINASEHKIKKIIKENNIQGKKGKSKTTEIRDFYPFEEVKELIADLSHTNKNNELMIDGKKYLTIYALSKLEIIDASQKKIKRIIRENDIQGVKGKSKMGKILDFYPVEEVKKHTNVNKDLPHVNKQNKHSTPKNKPKTINRVLKLITELPQEFQEHNRKALETILEIQNDTKSKALACMKKATFIKGEAFEQLVGVFLAYQYPKEKIIPQYCLIVDPENGYYGLRADYKVGNDIYEIKWGRATEAIDECTEKQIKHIQEGMNYKLISCVLNEKTKETFTPFLEEVKEKLKNDDCVEIFSSLTEKIKELADLDDIETLKKYRDAFFSIYVNAMDENNDRKEYIEEMMLDIATTTNLDEFIEANELTESPASLDANFEYKGKLYQGKVLISKNIDKDAEEIEEEMNSIQQKTNKEEKVKKITRGGNTHSYNQATTIAIEHIARRKARRDRYRNPRHHRNELYLEDLRREHYSYPAP